MIPLPRLGDERVRLRAYGPQDVADVVAGCRDPLVQLYTRVPEPYDEEDARIFIAGAGIRRVAGESLDLAIVTPSDDRFLGAIGLLMDRHDEERAEVGYWVMPGARGEGVAGRALMLLSRWALREAGLARLDLQAALSNTASLRVAESCGFVREGVMRQAWYRGPARSDMALFSLLPDDLDADPAR